MQRRSAWVVVDLQWNLTDLILTIVLALMQQWIRFKFHETSPKLVNFIRDVFAQTISKLWCVLTTKNEWKAKTNKKK